MKTLGIATFLAGAPALTLVCLAMFQWADFWPAMVGIVVSFMIAYAVALVWERDLALLIESVRRVASIDAIPVAETESAVTMNALGREIERLSRRLASRAALQEQHRRADTLILERLPDPVIVLARDRSVRRTNAAARSAFGDDRPCCLIPAFAGRSNGRWRPVSRRPPKSCCAPPSNAIYTPRWCRWTRRWPMAARPWWCCRTAPGNAWWNACVPISSPMSAMSCARRWPR
jgi:hypothetical protein